MSKLPNIKKKVTEFLTREDGKISKENLLKTGILLSAIALASVKQTEGWRSYTPPPTPPPPCPNDAPGYGDHCNEMMGTEANNEIIANHAHSTHTSHASY